MNANTAAAARPSILSAHTGLSLRLNVPAFFEAPEFISWLNNGNPKFTWHQGGTPSEYSDVIVLLEPNLLGEGTDSDMPAQFWDQIVQACRDQLGKLAEFSSELITVRLTNLKE